jgi:hypothetical protein
MNMQYANAVTAHEEAQRHRPGLAVGVDHLKSARPEANGYPDLRHWPKGRGCL